MGARYYAAWLGRWTSADPLGIGADGPGLYNYTRGSPVVFTDPGGTDKFEPRQDARTDRLMSGKISQEEYESEQAAEAVGAILGFAAYAAHMWGPAAGAVIAAHPTATVVVTNVMVGVVDPHPAGFSPMDTPGPLDDLGRAVSAPVKKKLGSFFDEVFDIADRAATRLARGADSPAQGLRPARKFDPDPTPVRIEDALELAQKHTVEFDKDLKIELVEGVLPRNVMAEMGTVPAFDKSGVATFRTVLVPDAAEDTLRITLPSSTLASEQGTVSGLAHEAIELGLIREELETLGAGSGKSWLDVPFTREQWRSWTQSRVQNPAYKNSPHERAWTGSNQLIEREFPVQRNRGTE